MNHTFLRKTALALCAGALLTAGNQAYAAFIQLTPFGNPPGGIIDTNYIEFTSNSSAQHFEELDTWFVPVDLVMTDDSGQNNLATGNFTDLDTTGWQYMVVRYEKNGPAPDLMGAFNLNGETSVTAAQFLATVPDHEDGYEYKQAFLYNARVVPDAVPEGGMSLALLGLGLAGLGLTRRFLGKKA